jgi:acyl carrier protein
MAAAVAEARARFGALHGVVHAAGLPGGGVVQLKSRAAAERVLAPKVRGTLALERALAGEPLDFVLLCSSINGTVGGFGQADYCAANAFLDAFPRSEWPLADRAVTVNWGGLLGSSMWIPREDDVGMELSDAVRALERALAANVGPRISIAPVHVEDARPWLPSRAEQGGGTGSGAPPERSLAELEARLAELWAEALELDEVPLDGDFFELGGNSLLGIELLWRLADELGFRLPMQLLVEAATPAAVARAIEARLGAAASS